MNATVNAPCPHGCPWPARECCDRHDIAESYVAPILLIGGFAVVGYIALGASLILLGRLAWNAVRAHLGG